MSSFLMNSGAYTDPKFGAADDYSQGTYLPHSDYYTQQQLQERKITNFKNIFLIHNCSNLYINKPQEF